MKAIAWTAITIILFIEEKLINLLLHNGKAKNDVTSKWQIILLLWLWLSGIRNKFTLNNIKHFPIFAVSKNIEKNKVRGVLNHLPKTTLYL